MAAMSETWPDYFYLWRLWQDIEGAGGGWDAYISDTWNQFDLIAYALLFSSEILNVAAFCLRSSDASWYQVRRFACGADMSAVSRAFVGRFASFSWASSSHI